MPVGGFDVLERSLVAGKMSLLDDKTTATMQFRRALEQNAILLLFLRNAA
jgi:uracil phosphoribosyltransferase